jgi:hypothetical protein
MIGWFRFRSTSKAYVLKWQNKKLGKKKKKNFTQVTNAVGVCSFSVSLSNKILILFANSLDLCSEF